MKLFVTFEGIDGSGKSTQINLLQERLDRNNHRVRVFREPGGTTVSEKVRAILLDPVLDIDPVTELFLFASARSQLMAEKVIPLLEQSFVVVLDRFYDSTTAYQGYGRKSLSIDDIRRLNDAASHRIIPDLTFYLRIELEEAKKRTENSTKDRMERSGDDFYRNVIEGFDRMAGEEERIITLDASLPKEELHEKIWGKISDLL